MDNKLNRFLDYIEKKQFFNPKGNWGTGSKFDFYASKLFEGIDLNGKTVLDIGAGNGVFSIYASLKGAKSVLALEPEIEGGANTMTNTFDEIVNYLNIDNIKLEKYTFQEIKEDAQKFDVIILHNSINHLNEKACLRLGNDEKADSIYQKYFNTLYDLTTLRGDLIITDVSNRNFFGDLKIKNPIAPSIEWELHRGPDVWQTFAINAGYQRKSIHWTTLSGMKKFGSLLFNNKLAGYFSLSHFRLYMHKVSE